MPNQSTSSPPPISSLPSSVEKASSAPTATVALAAPSSAAATSASVVIQGNQSNDLASQIKPFTADALMNGMATLVGALVGAMLAYVLQRKFQRLQELKIELTSAHRLMFALLHQVNTIVLIQKDLVFSELNNPARFLSIPAVPPYDIRKNVLELPELAFLLDEKAGREILYDFYMAQENYLEALNQWNLRSALHFEKVQPALAASGIQMGSRLTEAELTRILGAHVFGAIVNSTDNSIESLRRSFERLVAVKQKALPYLVRRFKTKDFTNFDFPETFGLTDPAAD